MKTLCTSLAAAAALALSMSAQAVPTAYANPGVANPNTYSLTAQSTGTVSAYFVGSTAAYVNEITLWVNGLQTGIYGLNTKNSGYGDKLDFGSVNAGDKLVFELVNLTPGNVGPWYTDQTLNGDGAQHIYSAHYNGDNFIPAGTFVAFEDLPNGGDFNYNDENFVFTNVALQQSNVPEPASLALLALGAVGMRFGRKLRRKQVAA